MTNKGYPRSNLGDEVRQYYAHKELPETSFRRLMIESRTQSSTARRWIIVGALAATLAVIAVGLGMIRQGAGRPTGPIDPAVAGPRLVAVQIHADWCARSPEVAPIFADLMTEYGNEPMLFVTLDITDDVRRGQAKLLAETLGIQQAFEQPFESGMIKLIDRQADTLLAAITGSGEASELALRIAEALGSVDPESEGEGGGGA